MNKYSVHFLIMAFSFSCGYMSGMEKEQKTLMVERKAMNNALSQLVFVKNENVLQIGFHGENIIKRKTGGAQISATDVHALSTLEECGLCYDKVLTFACWNVVKNLQTSVMNSGRLLKSNGQFCAVLPYYKSPYINIHHQTFTNDTWKDFYDKDNEVVFCGSKAIKKLLVEAGISTNITCDIIKKPFVFKTKEEFMVWIASYAVELDGIIPQERQAEFMNDVVNNYLAQYPMEQDNSVKLYLPYMIVSGYKS